MHPFTVANEIPDTGPYKVLYLRGWAWQHLKVAYVGNHMSNNCDRAHNMNLYIKYTEKR